MNDSSPDDELLSALYDAQLAVGLPILAGYDLAARFVLPPAHTEPAGTWFDVITLSRDRVALVSGHVVETGAVGAASAGQVRAVLRAALADSEDVVAALELADVFARLSREVRGTSVVVAVLDGTSRSMTYCTAGHAPPMIMHRDGTARVLDVTGSGPLGSGLSFACAEHRLHPGELVVLHSSGLADVPARAVDFRMGAVTGPARGSAVPGPSRDQPDPRRSSQVERVCDAVVDLAARTGGAVPAVVLVAQARVRSLPELRLEIATDGTAVRQAHEALTAWLASITAAPMAAMAVVHAGTELVANAVEHAQGSSSSAGEAISVRAALSQDGEVTVEVSDRGAWRGATGGVARGRGLAMAAGLVDHLEMSANLRGTQASLRHRLWRPVQILDGAASRAIGPDNDLEVRRPAPGAVTLRGYFGHHDVERVATDLLLASQGGTRDLTVDLSGVTHLSSAAARLLRDTVHRYATSDWPSRVVFRAAHGSPVRSALELAHVPYVPA